MLTTPSVYRLQSCRTVSMRNIISAMILKSVFTDRHPPVNTMTTINYALEQLNPRQQLSFKGQHLYVGNKPPRQTYNTEIRVWFLAENNSHVKVSLKKEIGAEPKWRQSRGRSLPPRGATRARSHTDHSWEKAGSLATLSRLVPYK